MNKNEAQFLVGTSGWVYPHWKGTFYPKKLPQSEWFSYYAKKFPTVEINATFYRRFKNQTYINWYNKAPADFSYVLKVHRLITHRKYLIDAEPQIKEFCRSASFLKEKLGLILLQLAPNTSYDLDRLKKAIQTFSDTKKIAVEFRNKEWFNEDTKKLLKKTNSVFCSVDSPKTKLIDWLTSSTAYIRLHGRNQWYAYDYSIKELKEIADLAKNMANRGANKIYIFFNNDFNGYAPKNALTLLKMLKY